VLAISLGIRVKIKAMLRAAAAHQLGIEQSESATDVGISFSTARTHLARIFDKTGVRRQAELVRLMAQIDEHR
jgi:DNA-binding NarL/FixJ family response regulator